MTKARLARARPAAERDAIEASLVPVARAIGTAAQARAEEVLSSAEANAHAELASARAQAEHILVEARAEGVEAAERVVAAQLAAARREALEIILAARRAAYEALRSAAIAALVQRGETPEGRRLSDRLVALVHDRVGPSASVRRVGPGGLDAVAELGNRRATLGPSALVDQAFESLTDEIEALWA